MGKKASRRFFEQALAFKAAQPGEWFVIVDVAHWEDPVDFAALKAAGVDGVYLKGPAGRGLADVDPTVWERAGQARAAGLWVGIYAFAYPDLSEGDAEAEAMTLVEVVRRLEAKHGRLELAPCLDLEWDGNHLTDRQLTDWALTFMAVIERELGRECILYTGKHFLETELDEHVDELEDVLLWGARYAKGGLDGAPTPGGLLDELGWDIYQFSSSAAHPAVGGAFDINIARAGSRLFDFLRSIDRRAEKVRSLMIELEALLKVDAADPEHDRFDHALACLRASARFYLGEALPDASATNTTATPESAPA